MPSCLNGSRQALSSEREGVVQLDGNELDDVDCSLLYAILGAMCA